MILEDQREIRSLYAFFYLTSHFDQCNLHYYYCPHESYSFLIRPRSRENLVGLGSGCPKAGARVVRVSLTSIHVVTLFFNVSAHNVDALNKPLSEVASADPVLGEDGLLQPRFFIVTTTTTVLC